MKKSLIFQITGFSPEKLPDLFNKKIAEPYSLKDCTTSQKPLEIGCYAVHAHQDLCGLKGMPEDIQSIYVLLQPDQQICLASNDLFGEGIERIYAVHQYPHPVFDALNNIQQLLQTSYDPQAHAMFLTLCEQVFVSGTANAPHLCSLSNGDLCRYAHEFAYQYLMQHTSQAAEHPFAYF